MNARQLLFIRAIQRIQQKRAAKEAAAKDQKK